MTVLEVLELATQAAVAAYKAYERSLAAAHDVDNATALHREAASRVEIVTAERTAAAVAVKTAYTKLSQQVKALSLASPSGVAAAETNLESQRATLDSAVTIVSTARESSKEARARVDRAVALANHAASIRNAIVAASDVTNASANFGGTKEAAFTHNKLLEARAAAYQAANDAALQASIVSKEADMVDAITMAAEIKTDTARLAVTTAETALSMAHSAHAAVQTVLSTLNKSADE